MKTKCDHTVHLTDEHGNAIGSWVDQRRKNGRIAVICGTCGRFYGYLAEDRHEQTHHRKHAASGRGR